ncbi:hypothetical protein FO488_03335 [Geobacter sp. FeAm09]|uniref:hypothetical protein n=1 Tax=Geobacter sp. FeAm09 TaxID=2597769 RepID=UPI0011EEC149|nr:hypothetical protein [Geobacter sp. FeAm09]QEM67279.1 hypothetical protein FO488_03335 [Geobacter sp. FeAm09]
MQILLFARDGVADHIRDAVTRTVPQTEVISAMDDLVGRFRRPSGEPVVAVLIAGSLGELAALRQMKGMLHDCRTVLILPDREAETVAAGHRLHPRFLGCLDDAGEEIAAVLCKMLNQQKRDRAEYHAG